MSEENKVRCDLLIEDAQGLNEVNSLFGVRIEDMDRESLIAAVNWFAYKAKRAREERML